MALADNINALPTTIGDGNTGHLNNHEVIHAGLKSHETRLTTYKNISEAADEALGERIDEKADKSAMDAADTALGQRIDAEKWNRGYVPEGSDVRTLAAGVWKVFSSETAGALVNAPPHAEAKDTSVLDVRIGGRDRKEITWTAFRPASGQPTIFRTHQDSGGAWSEWSRIWPVAYSQIPGAPDPVQRGNVPEGADVRALGVGVWRVFSKTTANTLANAPGPEESRDTALIDVQIGGRDRKVVTWTALRPATGQPAIFRTHQDSGGAWSDWTQVWPISAAVGEALGAKADTAYVDAADQALGNRIDEVKWNRGNVPTGADVRTLGEGDWRVFSSVTANGLVNAPPQSQSRDTSVITVRMGGRDRKIVTWTAMRPATGGEAYSFQTHQDSGGAWSEWTQTWPIEAQGSAPPQDTEATAPILSRAMWDYHLGMRRTQLAATPGTPLWGWAGVEGQELTIPTHEGSGQACHPSVVHVPGGWNGYEYWMAMTPYPYSAEQHEDPDIIASHDGTTWEVPVGLTNPLDDQTGRPNAHNSDTYLDLGPDGVMRVIWRMVDRPNGNHNHFFMMTSTDGVTWTPKQEIYDTTGTEVSPTITWTGTAWRMYYCRSGVMYYRETASLDSPAWSNFITCTTELSPNPDRSWWHMDIQRVDGVWWCLMQDRKVGTTLHGDIYLWRSDDGQHWDNSPMPLVQRVGDNHDSIYKSAILINGEGTDMTFDVFYSTYAHATREWAIRRTTAAYLN